MPYIAPNHAQAPHAGACRHMLWMVGIGQGVRCGHAANIVNGQLMKIPASWHVCPHSRPVTVAGVVARSVSIRVDRWRKKRTVSNASRIAGVIDRIRVDPRESAARHETVRETRARVAGCH